MKENIPLCIKWFFIIIIGAFLYKIIMDFLRNDSIKELLRNLSYQETTNKVMDNLE